MYLGTIIIGNNDKNIGISDRINKDERAYLLLCVSKTL